VILEGGSDDTTISVVAHGSARRLDLDRALCSAKAGCVPGHHAELRIDWVESRLAATEPMRRYEGPGWLTHVDDDRKWVMAPIYWEPENLPCK